MKKHDTKTMTMTARKTRQRITAWAACLGMLMATAMPAGIGGGAAYAQQNDRSITPAPVEAGQLNPVLQAMVNHPDVASARSEICAAAGRYDQARSQQLPQVDFSLGGNSVITDSFKDERDGNTDNDRNTRARGTARDDSASNYKRIDGTFTITQLIYDWGLTGSDKKIALNSRAENSLTMQLQLDRIASEILDLSLQVSEQLQKVELYEAYREALVPISERVEASVDAGVLRVGDLRAMKIISLDAEIQHSLATRQAGITEGELVRRFGINFTQARELLDVFLANRPEVPADIASNNTREVRLIDIRIQTSNLNNTKLRAELFPRLQVVSDLRLFDIDDFDNEYEVVGRFNMAMPIFDGGSNKARRAENLWQQRGLVNSRANTIRQHRNAVQSNRQSIARARENLQANIVKETEAAQRYEESLAREGVTVSDPIALARSLEQLATIRSEQISLRREVEVGLLSGLYFSDQLGMTLELPYGGPQC